MAVYLDLVVLLNFLVDLLLLLGTNRLTGFPPGVKRAAAAAGIGAVYSGACLLPGFLFLGNTLWRLVFLSLMASVAFGWNRSALKRGGIFLLLSMALGGMAVGFGKGGFGMLVLSAVGVWLLCRVGFGGKVGQEYIPIEVTHNGNSRHYIALRDTGNTLRDPITGERVLVLSADAAMELCDLSPEHLNRPMETILTHPGFRLIPYRAVGQPGSMLLGVRADVTMEGKRRKAVVAFAPEIIGRGECYQALVC